MGEVKLEGEGERRIGGEEFIEGRRRENERSGGGV